MKNHIARPVIPLLAAFAGGIIIASNFSRPAHCFLIYSLLILSVCFLVKSILKKESGLFAPLLFIFCSGYLSIYPYFSPKFSNHHITHFISQEKREIQGCILDPPVYKNNSLSFTFSVTSLKAHDKPVKVKGLMRVNVYKKRGGDLPELSRGDDISIESKIQPVKSFHNPGGFDYQRYMAFKHIRATGYTTGDKVKIRNKNKTPGFKTAIDSTRKTIRASIEKTGPGDHIHVLSALLIGDMNNIPDYLTNEFNLTGITHILSISGLHVSIVATVFFFLFRYMLSMVPFFLWHALTNRGAAILTIIPVSFYCILSGMSPPTQRSFIMIAAILILLLIRREKDAMNGLASAAFIILIFSPASLYSVSFQLSFVSVFWMFFGLSMIDSRPELNQPETGRFSIKSFIKKWRNSIRLSICLSLFAILGTMPIVIYYFNRTSLIGVLANLIFIPAIGFGVIPLGLVSIFLYPLSPFVSQAGLSLSSFILEKSMELLHIISRIPHISIYSVTPSLVEIACYYSLFFAALFLVKKHKSADAVSRRKFIFTIGFIILALAVLTSDILFWVNKRFRHNDMRVTIIDVGTGNSSLIEFPKGICFLIDGGGFPDNASFDIGEKIVAPLLWSNKIKTIDTVILSHPDSDHLNGLIFILRHFNVKTVLMNNQPADSKGYEEFMKLIHEKKINAPVFDTMPKTLNINGARVSILYPPDNFMDLIHEDQWRKKRNNNSMVIRIAYKNYAFLFPADITLKAEEELVELAGASLKSNILIAPHHGSKSSNSQVFIDSVQPEIAVISTDLNTRLHLPHQSVLEKYTEKGCSVYRTDLNGAIIFSTEGEKMNISTAIK